MMVTRRYTKNGQTSLKVFHQGQPQSGIYTIRMVNGDACIITPLLHDPISVEDARRVAGEVAEVAEIAARFEAEMRAALGEE